MKKYLVIGLLALCLYGCNSNNTVVETTEAVDADKEAFMRQMYLETAQNANTIDFNELHYSTLSPVKKIDYWTTISTWYQHYSTK